MLNDIVSVNGRIVSSSDAAISVDNLEFVYGHGVYESLKVRNGLLYFPEMHVQRLRRSASVIGIDTPYEKEILDYLRAFVEKISEKSFNVKMLFVGETLYIFATAPKYIPAKLYKEGVQVITARGERPFPNAKTLSMLTSYLAFTHAKKKGAYDALMVDNQGYIPEGSRANLFYTDGKTIFTPPVKDVLDGVTRQALFEILPKHNIPLEERRLKKEELNEFKGFFLTSTSAKVLPVTQIDGKKFEIPEIVKKVMEQYALYLRDHKAHHS